MQCRGPVRGQTTRLVEFVGWVGEPEVRTVGAGKTGVAGVPGPVGDGDVEVWEVGWEEDWPEVCAGEGGDGVGADLPCSVGY